MADNAKKNILTYAGLQELEAELEDLKVLIFHKKYSII